MMESGSDSGCIPWLCCPDLVLTDLELGLYFGILTDECLWWQLGVLNGRRYLEVARQRPLLLSFLQSEYRPSGFVTPSTISRSLSLLRVCSSWVKSCCCFPPYVFKISNVDSSAPSRLWY